ncbi:hypothetical protein [Stenotrophomonas lacuserhaii]|uniref:hypothetical protein n=1 Tax=Stenotrophomonas lacuserhaii TaxID=2760084 RepID=UPI0032EFCD4F
MHTPSPCSTGSAPSRLEWRPSRLQALAEAMVLLAAPWLIGASGMPVRLQPPVVLLCWLVQAVLLWRRLGAPCRVLWLQDAPRPLLLDGMELEDPALHVRGPWLQLRWQGPGKRRGVLLFWPDVLSPGQRRELRLAVRARQVSRKPP